MAAQSINAEMIVVFTHAGVAAGLLSKLRPQVPIIAFTPDPQTLSRMSLYWGTTSKLIARKSALPDAELVADIEKLLIREKLLKKGDSIVFVASSPFLGKNNVIRLHKVD
jgi:pyruvate kinase